MGIKSFELSAIDGRRLARVGQRMQNVRIDHNSTVTLITEAGEREATVDFRFTANYRAVEEVVGVIRIEGSLVYEGKGREVARQWSASGQMPNDVANEVHTTIMTVCIPEAVVIARDLRLPPPIPIPQVGVPAAPPPSKHSGMEVA
ncbi:MAG TPA: hypothetical protein VK723_01505 [Thermoplasmata archaeon]|nr:hypothetical protein [Thermoplasmata archaeon]